MPAKFHTSEETLGRGIAFPLQLHGGQLGMNEYDDHIRQAITLILRTAHTERMMRPDFGGGMEALAFEPMNAITAVKAQHQVQEALARFEPRIDLLAVDVSSLPEQGLLHIEITYRVRATDATHNLVYPFYLERGL